MRRTRRRIGRGLAELAAAFADTMAVPPGLGQRPPRRGGFRNHHDFEHEQRTLAEERFAERAGDDLRLAALEKAEMKRRRKRQKRLAEKRVKEPSA